MEQKFQYIPKQKRVENTTSNTTSQIELYTIGYGSLKFEEFNSILKENKISILADIRISPNGAYIDCYKKDFLQQNFETQTGIKYIWLKELGNPYHGTDGSLIQFAKLLTSKDRFTKLSELCNEKDAKVVILCGCKYVEKCHRNVVSKHFQQFCNSNNIQCKIINL